MLIQMCTLIRFGCSTDADMHAFMDAFIDAHSVLIDMHKICSFRCFEFDAQRMLIWMLIQMLTWMLKWMFFPF